MRPVFGVLEVRITFAPLMHALHRCDKIYRRSSRYESSNEGCSAAHPAIGRNICSDVRKMKE
jgi:hypothetical protein